MQMDIVEREQSSRTGSAEMVPILVSRPLVAAALLASGLVHFALSPEHMRESPLLGIGFLAVAGLQCVFGVTFSLRPAPHLWRASLVLVVFSLTVYVISRTLGLPFGHDHRSAPIAMSDIVAKSSEVIALGGLLVSIHATTRTWPRGRSLRLAPFNRYAYLLALILIGVIAALLLVHTGAHDSA